VGCDVGFAAASRQQTKPRFPKVSYDSFSPWTLLIIQAGNGTGFTPSGKPTAIGRGRLWKFKKNQVDVWVGAGGAADRNKKDSEE